MTGRVVMPDQGTLYILSDASPGDPLDCVTAAKPYLASQYTAVHYVGPGQAMSVRALQRSYEPGVDRLLYDFTPPADHDWAFGMLGAAPAAVLLGGCSPVSPGAPLADLRSAQRYAARGHRFSPAVTIGVLDATHGSAIGLPLSRPSATIAPAADNNDLIMAVAPSTVETAYATLRGVKSQGAALTLLCTSRRDANDLAGIIAAFGIAAARIRYIRTRVDIASAMAGVGGLIDLCDADAPALSDTTFTARCLGAPVLTLNAPDGAAAAAEAFAASAPRKDHAAAQSFADTRPITPFAKGLHALIEAVFAHAMQPGAAA